MNINEDKNIAQEREGSVLPNLSEIKEYGTFVEWY
jgi:hypothetical protein